ncbi:hypothetical protein C9374_006751 [Naegleria lovaniensis]|uniref:Cilia- and flagella-associated protein 157 n=1 Tax=Naegleria lovaniensis TaxID=51637 RepID=A0AA88KM94_NAELO|nr:uncharacterized protein C9374_006751 [Naegleria lovaniensis]KAG2379634.1 hypothetical protein C9374_006751 [Naegleria lovaniensis]
MPKKKEEKKSTPEQTPEELKSQLDDLKLQFNSEKTTLSLAIQTLTKKVERKTEECQRLEHKIAELKLIIEARIQDNKAILEQFDIDRRKSEQSVEYLQKENDNLLQKLSEVKYHYESTISEITRTKDKEIIDLKHLLNTTRHNETQVEDIQKLKNELEEENSSLKKQIRRLKDEHFVEIMQMKKMFEEELKSQEQNLIEGFTSEKQAIIKSTDEHLSKKTLQTMQKNQQLKERIEHSTQEAGKIISENKRLEEENKQLRHETNMEKIGMDEMQKKLASYLKTIKSLSQKIKEMEAQKHIDTPTREKYKNYTLEEMKNLAEEKDLLVASARKEIETLKDRLDLYKKSMAKYEAQIQTEDEIGKFIIQVMNDIKLGYWKEKGEEIRDAYNKKKGDQWKPEKDVIPMNLTKLSVQERETLFSFLLSKLHTFDRKNIRKEPSTNDLLSNHQNNITSSGGAGARVGSGGGSATSNNHHSRSSPSLYSPSQSPVVVNTSPILANSDHGAGGGVASSEEFTLPPIHYHVSYKQRLAEFRKKTEKY